MGYLCLKWEHDIYSEGFISLTYKKDDAHFASVACIILILYFLPRGLVQDLILTPCRCMG